MEAFNRILTNESDAQQRAADDAKSASYDDER